MFSQAVIDEIVAQSKSAGIPPAALLALVDIESGGKVAVRLGGRLYPLIRFEGHYFDRRLSGAKRAHARREKLASPRTGAVKNPRGQAARWNMYRRAKAIDAKAAIESISWGIGQVMGAHWAWLGYPSAEALFEEAVSGFDGQLRLMLRFVEKSGITPHLKARRWRDVARIYNGPAYARYKYHIKLAAAEKRWSARLARHTPASTEPMRANSDLALGARGAAVRQLQQQLGHAGHEISIDGVFGRQTRGTLRAFQREHGRAPTGIADAPTRQALADAFARTPRRSVIAWITALLRSVFGK